MAEEPPQTEVLSDNLEVQAEADRVTAWERLRHVHWVIKMGVGAVVFGGVSLIVGNQLVDRVVENQQPILENATDKVKDGLKDSFEKGACDIQVEVKNQAMGMQTSVDKKLKAMQRDIYEKIGIPFDEEDLETKKPKDKPLDCEKRKR